MAKSVELFKASAERPDGGKALRRFRRAQVVVFSLVLAGVSVFALIMPLRPSYSDTEKRKLTEFPSFSLSALLDGTYTDSLSLWYSDTFPMRDVIMSFNAKLSSLYGFGDRITKLNDIKGDDIPAPVKPEDTTVAPSEPETTLPPTTAAPTEPVIPDADKSLAQDLGSVYVVGDTGYELYTFVQSAADSYVYAVSNIANVLSGQANVYCILVPTSTDITMPANIRAQVNSSDQRDAINYMYSVMSANVRSVGIFDTLRMHRDEYLYFRTDHHWTADGAYYAYSRFCETAGAVCADRMTAFTQYAYGDFLGSFYSETKKNPAFTNPDTVYAYSPNSNTSYEYIKTDGTRVQSKIVTDVTTWSQSYKYLTFIGGDEMFGKIINYDIPDAPRCLVIKESFGNCFVPFLSANYSEVHIIDYRYWNGSISQYVAENGITDVIFINNMSATRANVLMDALKQISY